jgi:hypothetical protein
MVDGVLGLVLRCRLLDVCLGMVKRMCLKSSAFQTGVEIVSRERRSEKIYDLVEVLERSKRNFEANYKHPKEPEMPQKPIPILPLVRLCTEDIQAMIRDVDPDALETKPVIIGASPTPTKLKRDFDAFHSKVGQATEEYLMKAIVAHTFHLWQKIITAKSTDVMDILKSFIAMVELEADQATIMHRVCDSDKVNIAHKERLMKDITAITKATILGVHLARQPYILPNGKKAYGREFVDELKPLYWAKQFNMAVSFS